jgi:hypothetical protein
LVKNYFYEDKLISLLEELLKYAPKLDDTGKNWTCFNKAGTELRWANQRGKNLQNSIEAALNNSNKGKKWEGQIANELSKYHEITDFSNEFKIIENGSIKNTAGDIDVGSFKYIIECK